MPRLNPNTQDLLKRLWIYQSERFPVVKTAILLIVFSASSVTASAQLAKHPLPSFTTYVVAFTLVFFFFWQLRAADEFKDNETDTRYRPERPVPRGLVSLKLIIILGFLSMILSAMVAFIYLPSLLFLVFIVWCWMGLMTVEFFAPHALHASPLLLLITHMLIMPLIDLVLTGCEWLPYGTTMPTGLWTFLLLSLANGCIFEFSRKIWAPENERDGVETYSSSWGITFSLVALLGVLAIAYISLLSLSLYHNLFFLFAFAGLLAAIPFLYQIFAFYRSPTPQRQKALDNASGVWVILCYILAALLPFLKG